MAALQYTGTYGSIPSLNNSPSVSLSRSGEAIDNYRVTSVVARIYCSTSAYSKTYRITAAIQGASGTISQKFTSSNYGGAWIEITLTRAAGFDPNAIQSLTVSCSTDGDKVFLRNNTMTVTINYQELTACTPPTVITAPAVVAPADGIPITWSGQQAGQNVSISGFAIFRSTDPNYQFEQVGESTQASYTDNTAASGGTYYYRVMTLCSTAGYSSDLSQAVSGGTKVNTLPTAPTVVGSGATYNPRPRLLITAGSDPDGDALSIQAAGFLASSSPVTGGGKSVLRRSAAWEAGTYPVTVQNVDPSAGSALTDVQITVLSPAWTDDPIIAGTTRIKAAHINELRQALETVCAYYGMAAPSWETGQVIAGVTPDYLFPAHAAELQSVVRQIAAFVNAWDPTSSGNNIILPSLENPSTPKAAVINQLRQIVTLL